MRNEAPERQRASGAAEHEWRPQRIQLERAIGLAEAQIGGQQAVIGENSHMISRAEKYVADIGARAGGELIAAFKPRLDVERRLRESHMWDER